MIFGVFGLSCLKPNNFHQAMIPSLKHVYLRTPCGPRQFLFSCLLIILFHLSYYSLADDVKKDLWSIEPLNPDFKSAFKENDPSEEHSNPVDVYITRSLKEKGLKMSCPEDPARLLRRVSLDVTGLPTSPEFIEQALASSFDWDQVYEQ